MSDSQPPQTISINVYKVDYNSSKSARNVFSTFTLFMALQLNSPRLSYTAILAFLAQELQKHQDAQGLDAEGVVRQWFKQKQRKTSGPSNAVAVRENPVVAWIQSFAERYQGQAERRNRFARGFTEQAVEVEGDDFLYFTRSNGTVVVTILGMSLLLFLVLANLKRAFRNDINVTSFILNACLGIILMLQIDTISQNWDQLLTVSLPHFTGDKWSLSYLGQVLGLWVTKPLTGGYLFFLSLSTGPVAYTLFFSGTERRIADNYRQEQRDADRVVQRERLIAARERFLADPDINAELKLELHLEEEATRRFEIKEEAEITRVKIETAARYSPLALLANVVMSFVSLPASTVAGTMQLLRRAPRATVELEEEEAPQPRRRKRQTDLLSALASQRRTIVSTAVDCRSLALNDQTRDLATQRARPWDKLEANEEPIEDLPDEEWEDVLKHVKGTKSEPVPYPVYRTQHFMPYYRVQWPAAESELIKWLIYEFYENNTQKDFIARALQMDSTLSSDSVIAAPPNLFEMLTNNMKTIRPEYFNYLIWLLALGSSKTVFEGNPPSSA